MLMVLFSICSAMYMSKCIKHLVHMALYLLIFINRESGEIIRLVASVYLSVPPYIFYLPIVVDYGKNILSLTPGALLEVM